MSACRSSAGRLFHSFSPAAAKHLCCMSAIMQVYCEVGNQIAQSNSATASDFIKSFYPLDNSQMVMSSMIKRSAF